MTSDEAWVRERAELVINGPAKAGPVRQMKEGPCGTYWTDYLRMGFTAALNEAIERGARNADLPVQQGGTGAKFLADIPEVQEAVDAERERSEKLLKEALEWKDMYLRGTKQRDRLIARFDRLKNPDEALIEEVEAAYRRNHRPDALLRALADTLDKEG